MNGEKKFHTTEYTYILAVFIMRLKTNAVLLRLSSSRSSRRMMVWRPENGPDIKSHLNANPFILYCISRAVTARNARKQYHMARALHSPVLPTNTVFIYEIYGRNLFAKKV